MSQPDSVECDGGDGCFESKVRNITSPTTLPQRGMPQYRRAYEKIAWIEAPCVAMVDLPRWFLLNRREFERQFALAAIDSKEMLVLDGMDLLEERSLIRIRSHDIHGPLPEVALQVYAADRLGAFQRLGTEAVKLSVTVRIRRELAEAFPGTTFLPPTTMDDECVVGIQWGGRTVLAEASD